MRISKTPLRISFFGGGSDLPAFTEKENGAALSATINKFVYVITNETQRPLRFIHEDIQYGLSNMRNNILKETIEEFGITKNLDIVSMSDIDAVGAGLGGSSAFTVGLLNVLEHGNMFPTHHALATKACEIEIDKCGYPIGIQDQYAVTWGGFHLWEFHHNPRYADPIDNLIYDKSIIDTILEQRLVLIFSGMARSENAGTILQSQQKSLKDDPQKFELMKRIRDRAYIGTELLHNDKFDEFGELLHENWMDKKSLSIELSNPNFDYMYEFGLKNGAIGGKLLGAGGGGFFLFYLPKSVNTENFISDFLREFPYSKYYPFQFYPNGSRIV